MINQSGLATPYISGQTDFDLYDSFNNFDDDFFWTSGGPLTGVVDFDMGQSIIVEQIAMYDFGSASGTASVNNFDIFASNDPNFTNSTFVGNFNFDFQDSTIQKFDVDDSKGRFVRLQTNSNHGWPNFTGFGEFLVGGNAIPEPCSSTAIAWGALLIGLRRIRR